MTTLTGTFETQNARKYLQQLCKHFAHKVEVRFTETDGEAELPCGVTHMSADENRLLVSMRPETDAAVAQGKFIIDSHLQRFAFREDFQAMEWTTS